MNRKRSRGFTLTEMMIAVTISVLIFTALGTLLSRCFSLWLGSQAQWKLAQHARVTRSRLLYGGFGTGTGLLNATNVAFGGSTYWKSVRFDPVTESGSFYILGWPGSSPQHLWLLNDSGNLAYAQTVAFASSSDQPTVRINNFSAAKTNSTVTLSYTLNLVALGKTNKLPQVVEAKLINE